MRFHTRTGRTLAMSHNALRFMSTLAGAIGLVLGVAEHGLAQQMSFAVYSDVTLSGDGNTVYNYGSAADNSSGCTHWNYATTAQLNSPTGRAVIVSRTVVV